MYYYPHYFQNGGNSLTDKNKADFMVAMNPTASEQGLMCTPDQCHHLMKEEEQETEPFELDTNDNAF